MTFRTIEVSDPRFEHEGLRHVTVKSAALRGRADLTVWVPDNEAPVGLVILLHGVYGSHWCWAMRGGAHRTAARLVAAGEIPPFVLAMPSDGLRGDGTGYARHGDGVDFQRWIADEVPLAARAAVPALAGLGEAALLSGEPTVPSAVPAGLPLFVAGLSMGGFGALRIGAAHHDRFAAISAHSSITHVWQMSQFIEESVASLGIERADGSALEAIVGAGASLPPLRFDCGRADQLLDANRQLHRGLVERHIEHTYDEFPGGHDWAYWEKHVADSLRFFARVALPRR
jgi:putative tributyrin esterase